jgi:hypothetical protein
VSFHPFHRARSASRRTTRLPFSSHALHEYRGPSSLPSPVLSWLESDAAGFGCRWLHQLPDGVEQGTYVGVM